MNERVSYPSICKSMAKTLASLIVERCGDYEDVVNLLAAMTPKYRRGVISEITKYTRPELRDVIIAAVEARS